MFRNHHCKNKVYVALHSKSHFKGHTKGYLTFTLALEAALLAHESLGDHSRDVALQKDAGRRLGRFLHPSTPQRHACDPESHPHPLWKKESSGKLKRDQATGSSLDLHLTMRRFTTVAALALWLLVAVALTVAECPNGCSGNGACMQKDMCNCYKNYQGNDCADRTCPFGYAHVDTPKGDIDMDMDRLSDGWLLTDSQQHPAGTYEFFNPDAKANEAHFYMECSNKGVCDRATGTCMCFDGYEGSGCHRTTCPSKCTGQGTCESMRELGAKAGGTLFGIEHPGGAVSYDLWDANSTYGCRCDPWFRGPDCSKRTCKVGVDPLFLAAGTARYETFVIHAFTTAVGWTSGSWIRLRVFDYYGESYITSKIPILDDTAASLENANKDANAAAVLKALKAVPNLTFRDIKCGSAGRDEDFIDFVAVRATIPGRGMSVICQYIDNPGKHRIPEVESYVIDTTNSKAFVVTTGVQGENDEWFTKQSTLTVTTITDSIDTPPLAMTVVGNLGTNLPVSIPMLMKVGEDIVLAVSWSAQIITLAFSLKKQLGTNPSVFLPSFASGSAITVTALAGTQIPSVAVNVGDDFFTFTAKPSFTTGTLLFFHNQFFYVQNIYESSPTGGTFYATLDKPFGGDSRLGGSSTPPSTGPVVIGDIPYIVVLPEDQSFIYNYVSECAGRGLCTSDTGICACFKGYTNDNCNTQNILAL